MSGIINAISNKRAMHVERNKRGRLPPLPLPSHAKRKFRMCEHDHHNNNSTQDQKILHICFSLQGEKNRDNSAKAKLTIEKFPSLLTILSKVDNRL